MLKKQYCSNISRSSCHDTVHMSGHSSKIVWQHCKNLKYCWFNLLI